MKVSSHLTRGTVSESGEMNEMVLAAQFIENAQATIQP